MHTETIKHSMSCGSDIQETSETRTKKEGRSFGNVIRRVINLFFLPSITSIHARRPYLIAHLVLRSTAFPLVLEGIHTSY